MKNATLPFTLTLLAVLALLLSACAKAQAQAGASAPGSGGARQPDPRMQLALGTLALEDTPNAVTAEQALALLPLWKAADSLTGADNVASEELSGLFDQIEESMTAEQVQAIQALDLSGQGMADLASKYGFQMGGGAGPGNLTPEMQSTMEAARASGQMPQGFNPGEGGAPPDMGAGSPSFELRGNGNGGQGIFRQGNASGNSGSASAATGNPIFQAVITLLEGKAQ
jgi:hypothetical protein